jgi:hypothetical protein
LVFGIDNQNAVGDKRSSLEGFCALKK